MFAPAELVSAERMILHYAWVCNEFLPLPLAAGPGRAGWQPAFLPKGSGAQAGGPAPARRAE